MDTAIRRRKEIGVAYTSPMTTIGVSRAIQIVLTGFVRMLARTGHVLRGCLSAVGISRLAGVEGLGAVCPRCCHPLLILMNGMTGGKDQHSSEEGLHVYLHGVLVRSRVGKGA